MSTRNTLKKWEIAGNKVILTYQNGETLTTTKENFDRATQVFITATYEELKDDTLIVK